MSFCIIMSVNGSALSGDGWAPPQVVPAGRPIRVTPGTIRVIEDGVVRVEAIHDDGSVAIIGFAGPGEALVHHSDRICHVQHIAHTGVRLRTAREPDHDSIELALVRRLRELEAWVAMLSHRGSRARLRAFAAHLAHGHPAKAAILSQLTQEQVGLAVLLSRSSVARARQGRRTGEAAEA